MATHSSVLAWKIPWTEEPRGLQSMGLQSDMTERAHNTHTYGETESMCVCVGIIFQCRKILTTQ